MLGTLGNIFFEAAEGYVNTFSSLSFSRSVSYAEHKILGSYPLLEFTGANTATCSLKMVFDITHGVNPKKSIEELERMLYEHECALFVLDGSLVGSGYWVIDSLSWSADIVDSFGGITRASADISLKEYRKEGEE